MTAVILKELQELLQRDAADISMAEAALLIAKVIYPDLDVAAYMERLDLWAETLRSRMSDPPTAEEIIYGLNGYLFDELEFTGNTEDYYDPRNGYLNEVMDRKLGIPITLSIIYMEVGLRLGLPLEGVSFPGHFLVKFSVENGEVVLDPFSNGLSLEESDLEDLLRQTYGDSGEARPQLTDLLVPASPQEILVRMLRNLKGIYLQRKELNLVLAMQDLILLIDPELGEEFRDRGSVYHQLECFRAALDDYQRYLELEPGADDAEEIRGRIIDLHRQSQGLH